MTVVTVNMVIDVDDHAWALVAGAGDAYDQAVAQRQRSLVADVRDYALNALRESAAAQEGAITSVDEGNEKEEQDGS